MDGSRSRRTRDRARRAWYARHRQRRFARRHGFPIPGDVACGSGHGGKVVALAPGR